MLFTSLKCINFAPLKLADFFSRKISEVSVFKV